MPLPAATSSPETVTAKQSLIPGRSSTASITGRFDDDASPSGQRSASRLTDQSGTAKGFGNLLRGKLAA